MTITDGTTKWRVKIFGGVPVGTIQYFGGNTPPEDWLLCDGNTISCIMARITPIAKIHRGRK